MERIAMSQRERDRLDWLKRARDGKMTQRDAAQRMGVSERWVRKLLRRMKQQGDAVVVHGYTRLDVAEVITHDFVSVRKAAGMDCAKTGRLESASAKVGSRK